MGIFDLASSLFGAFMKGMEQGHSEKKEEIDVHSPYNDEYECPNCGATMKYVGGLLEYECPNCGKEGSLEWDECNKQHYVSIGEEYSYEDIYEDPEGNMPACCAACGGPYPSCMTSCKIFDD